MKLHFFSNFRALCKDEELNFSAGDFRGYVATGLLLLYQVLVVILLLNLLIALMNSTVQKVEDQKLLYWKFVRTSIWYEFFDDQGSDGSVNRTRFYCVMG